jgi:hypothetical protein
VGVAAAVLESAQRHREHRLEVLDGIGVDFFEQGIAVALVIAVMENPVLRLQLRIERSLIGHVGRAHRRQRGRRKKRNDEDARERRASHDASPPV